MDKLLLLLFIVFSLPLASAQSLGSITYESDKKARVTAGYELGLFNLGNRSLEVELNSDDFEGEIEFDESSFILEPSKVSSDPSGSGWISLSGNKYVKPRDIKFSVRAPNSQNFTVDVTARGLENEGSSGPSVVQVQSHRLSYIRTSDPSFYEKEDEGTREKELELREDREEDSENANSGKDVENRTGEMIQIPGSSGSKNQERQGIDPLTLLLSVGAAGSLYYLWSVI